MKEISKVYVVHKTHLDIGFTDFSKKVLEHYVNDFIPKAIQTAYEVNRQGKPRQFVWTTGAYLIRYYLCHGDAFGIKRLRNAIADGYVDWHLLPCTTHTELMDAELFRYGLKIGQDLDAAFSKHHIAAKMTDVPGHTIAMVPYLKEAGISYIHIGINAASRPVDVPPLCLLKYGDSEVILNYAKDYGEACIFKNSALEFAHTADNIGPPDAKGVQLEMDRLRNKYPNAEIISCGLDDFAQEILPYKDELPVVTKELGDTWIHGAASDPYKTAMLCELKRIRKDWILADAKAAGSEEYDIFMENLLLLCEHTWGLDYKLYLKDDLNWDKRDFLRARAEDKADDTGGKYSKMELSWEEQRQYLERAVRVLPRQLKDRALKRKTLLCPSGQYNFDGTAECSEFSINGWKLGLKKDGSIKIISIQEKNFKNTNFGILRYDVYDSKTVYQCYHNYNRNLELEGDWAEPDFAKPGLVHSATAADKSYSFQIKGTRLSENRLTVCLTGQEEACRLYGCPRSAEIIYQFGIQKIEITLSVFEKDANRMPEAAFFGFQFENYEELSVTKLGLPVNPFHVIDGGNKKLHAVEEVTARDFRLLPGDSPLVSIGGRHLYDTEDEYGSLNEGLYFVLHNNRWNTNFPLWYGQSSCFQFEITMK